MRETCPRCKAKGVYYDDEPGYERNTCIYCAWSHTPKGYHQSSERQITGENKRFGIGLAFFEYEDSLKGKDLDYDQYTRDPLYHYKKDLIQRQDPLYEKKINMGKKLLIAIQKRA